MKDQVLPIFFLVLFAGAMVLGPLLYFGLAPIYAIPFHRAMDRALLISAVAALGLFWSRISLRRFWPWNSSSRLDLLLGYFIALISAQAMVGLVVAFDGIERIPLSSHQIWSRLLAALAAALLVPPLEETIFRGFLQGEMIRKMGWRGGWIGTAVIFMMAHFIKIPPEIDQQPVHLWSGVTAIGAAFLPVLHGDFLCGKGINLFLIGLILGGIYLRSGSLWLNAGLHSGWILAVLSYTGLTRPIPHPGSIWQGGEILSHPLTSVVLMMLGWWLWRYYRNPSIVPETGPDAP